MRAFSALHDPVYEAPSEVSALNRFFLSLIRDERDLPFIHLTLKIMLLMIPVGILMYVPGLPNWIWWTVAAVYLVLNNLVFKGPFGLMLHCTSHRKWFKSEYSFLNHLLPWFVGPFFGQTPETYYSHHIGMHHPENNMPTDKSSTMFYQRDSLKSFGVYLGRFFLFGLIELIQYFSTKKNRKKLARNAISGEISFVLMCIGLSFVNFPATFMVFILPFLIFRTIAMMGNFAQHTFIDPEDPGNSYTNSISCINHKYNHKCWNDGYHISHHLRPAMHWTEHPNHLTRNADKYVSNRALIFEGIDFLGVWLRVMKKDYEGLADKVVNLNGMWESKEEVIAVMKERTQRLPKERWT
ncbi:MAG: fatty acid desaturase [Bacteroidia bacterium]